MMTVASCCRLLRRFANPADLKVAVLEFLMSLNTAARVALTVSILGLAGGWTNTAEAGHGCGHCDSCQTTVHHVYRCKHHCHHCPPPYGIVVPSAPAYAAPLVAAPMYAPVTYAPAAPVTYAPAYAPQAAPQCSSSQAAPGAQGRSDEELAAALLKILLGNGGMPGSAAPAAPSVPADETLEERVSKLEQRVQRLERISVDLSDRVDSHDAKMQKLAP